VNLQALHGDRRKDDGDATGESSGSSASLSDRKFMLGGELIWEVQVP
jgi:hypothetical protein